MAEAPAAVKQDAAGVDRVVGYPFAGPWPRQAELLAEATRLADG